MALGAGLLTALLLSSEILQAAMGIGLLIGGLLLAQHRGC